MFSLKNLVWQIEKVYATSELLAFPILSTKEKQVELLTLWTLWVTNLSKNEAFFLLPHYIEREGRFFL